MVDMVDVAPATVTMLPLPMLLLPQLSPQLPPLPLQLAVARGTACREPSNWLQQAL